MDRYVLSKDLNACQLIHIRLPKLVGGGMTTMGEVSRPSTHYFPLTPYISFIFAYLFLLFLLSFSSPSYFSFLASLVTWRAPPTPLKYAADYNTYSLRWRRLSERLRRRSNKTDVIGSIPVTTEFFFFM